MADVLAVLLALAPTDARADKLSLKDVDEVAWWQDNCGDMKIADAAQKGDGDWAATEDLRKRRARLRSRPVAGLRANGFGLFDMLGNAAEFTAGVWPRRDSVRPADGSARPAFYDPSVGKTQFNALGGSINHVAGRESPYRAFMTGPMEPLDYVGFRVAW